MAGNLVWREHRVGSPLWKAVRFVLLVMAVSAANADSRAEASLTISIAAPAYWCPYACDAGESRWGFAVDIARAALESTGHRVHFRNLPYDRALFEARSGRIDATVPTFRGEAPGFIFPGNAVSMTEYCFYVAEDQAWRYTGPVSLQPIRFVATSGYSYGEAVDTFIAENLGQGVALIRGEEIPSRLRELVRMGRYDALLDDRLLFETNRNNDGLINAGCLEERHAGYLALSPGNPERSGAIAEAFDRGFNQIRTNGQLCSILAESGLGLDLVPGLDPEECSR